MKETTYELRQRVAKDAGLSPEAAASWQGEVEDVVVAEALAHAERVRGPEGKRDVIRRLSEIGSREEPAALRARVARRLGLPSELWADMSERAQTQEEVAANVVNLLRRSGDDAAAAKAEHAAGSLGMDAAIRERFGNQAGSLNDLDSTDMNELARAAARNL